MKNLIVLASLLVLSSCASVPAGRETFLGEREVSFHGQHAGIEVGEYSGWFTGLVARARFNSVEIFNIRVIYGNGEVDTLTEDVVLTPGSDISFHVDGTKRKIRRVEFAYKTVGNWADGRALVRLWGVR